VNNENLNLLNLSKQTKAEKISIVGYTEYKSNYKNNKAYKFLNNFNKEKLSTSPNKTGDTTPNKESSQQLIKKAHGKIMDLVNDVSDKKININININTNHKENVNEGLITSSRYYHQKNKSRRRKRSIDEWHGLYHSRDRRV